MPSLPSHPPESPALAIIGGGISGVTLTIALTTRSPHLPITLYESASAFGDIGAGVGFEPATVRTMSLIDPRIAAAFAKCSQGSTTTDPPIWFTVRVGDQRKFHHEGEENVTLERVEEAQETRSEGDAFVLPARRGPRGGVHRADFLDELVKLVPDGVVKFCKRLVDVTAAEDGSGDAVLRFADGSTAQHSAVLGCDGIKSHTRSTVLGGLDSAAAVFSGKYAYRGLVPMEKAVEVMGSDKSRTPQMYIGYHGHVLTFPIANGLMLNVVAFSSQLTWSNPRWVLQTSQNEMLQDFTHWIPSVRALVANLQVPDVWALFEHQPASSYYSTNPLICLVGDAAHAATPHQGAGAGMCIEDVYILSALISLCHSKADLKKAFYAYDDVRRPRTQKLVKTSREAGMLWEFEDPDAGDDTDALKRNAVQRMNWIWDYEIIEDLEKAKSIMLAAK
ncbi:salicylate 1-hydroxylase-like protein [Pyrenochaeta sp. MPI-SDFR-AT-0127]|nr:salicylate 1-hydroxylase-like protein [Pyrenochaeta sp. MPI-SDFR-AT-0127]